MGVGEDSGEADGWAVGLLSVGVAVGVGVGVSDGAGVPVCSGDWDAGGLQVSISTPNPIAGHPAD